MFAETEGSRKTIGDVDVVYHDGLYHLFHLVLPNHDFIAHAVSTNGINWRRVNTALFIGDPGSWDDLMLWTMHVSPDPHRPGHWRMFYTGHEYYLIGSVREDAKIRYWHTDQIGKPWRSYHDNVLMAKGNYAGRVCRDDKGWLLWNFFSLDVSDRTVQNLMPPPKRLTRTEEGLLHVTTFEGFEPWLEQEVDTRCVHALKHGIGEEHCSVDGNHLELQSEAGFQAFVFDESLSSFRFQAILRLRGKGKCGIVFRVDPENHDGYYLSLDLLKGVAQLRSWKTGPTGSGEAMMQFRSLQAGYWHNEIPGQADVQLLTYGSYLELSIDGRVILSLADQTFHEGLLGVYLETAHLELSDVRLNRLRPPFQSDEHLVTG